MNVPRLSYALTTFNKLPFLPEVLGRLVEQRQPDEEVVVTDGGSTDGTVEYLTHLFNTGAIQQLASEPDRGEAHGLNKALLLARGDVIKVLSDDDAFHWPAIRMCAEFMLANPEIDVLGTDGASVTWDGSERFSTCTHRHGFEAYRRSNVQFEFSGLGLMVRRRSLSLTGLFDPRFVRVDFEFTLRLTSGPARLAWHTAKHWVRVQNVQSNSFKFNEGIIRDTVRLRRYYGVIHWPAGPRATAIDCWKALLRPIKRKFLRLKPKELVPQKQSLCPPHDWPEVFRRCDEWLAAEHRERPGEFLM